MRMLDELEPKFLKAIVGDKPCLDIWEHIFSRRGSNHRWITAEITAGDFWQAWLDSLLVQGFSQIVEVCVLRGRDYFLPPVRELVEVPEESEQAGLPNERMLTERLQVLGQHTSVMLIFFYKQPH